MNELQQREREREKDNEMNAINNRVENSCTNTPVLWFACRAVDGCQRHDVTNDREHEEEDFQRSNNEK